MFDIGLEGTLGTIFTAIFTTLISLLCGVIATILSLAASLILGAMRITPDEIKTILGESLTNPHIVTSIASFITFFGFAIAFLFAVTELIKNLVSPITGDDHIVRPQTIIARSIIFGAWTIAAIPLSENVWTVASSMYNGLYSLAESTMETDLVTKISSIFSSFTDSATWSSAVGSVWVHCCFRNGYQVPSSLYLEPSLFCWHCGISSSFCSNP